MGKTISPWLKVTFIAGCFVAGIFGLIYTLVPAAYQNLIGVPVKQPTETTAFRELGAALLALSYAGWLGSKATVSDVVKIPAKMVTIWMVLGALAMLWGLISTELPAIYWLYAVLYAGFAVAFSVFYPRG